MVLQGYTGYLGQKYQSCNLSFDGFEQKSVFSVLRLSRNNIQIKPYNIDTVLKVVTENVF